MPTTLRSDWQGEAINIDTLELLDKLEDLVEQSKQFFNRAFVDIDEFYTITNKMKSSLPEDVRQADRITREADQIINDAKAQAAKIIEDGRSEAARIIEDGRAEAAKLVDESEITRLATIQSKEILSSAQEEARITKLGADEYAREVLNDLENFVGRVMGTIQKGRDRLGSKASVESDRNE